jgi:hypothetical protein
VASTSITDTGSYVITMTISDDFPSNMTTSFTVNVINASPKVVTAPGAIFLVHGRSLSIPLASNFADDDGDSLTMKATFTGPSGPIPYGLFTVPSPFTIFVSSKSITDTGMYTVTLTI